MRRAAPEMMLLLALAVAGTGCAKSSYVRGRITDCRGSAPVEDADVQLASPAPDVGWDAVKTGPDGAFVFKVPEPAKALPITLTAAKHGYQSVQKRYSAIPDVEDVCMQPTIR
jgi:hypothetical protein